jgi:hypothetical protein
MWTMIRGLPTIFTTECTQHTEQPLVFFSVCSATSVVETPALS